MTERSKRVVIQQTQGVRLRIMVEVLRCEVTRKWFVRWLDKEAFRNDGTRRDAILRAREVCGAMTDLGIDSELIIRRVNGTIGERRTYGRDPRRSRG